MIPPDFSITEVGYRSQVVFDSRIRTPGLVDGLSHRDNAEQKHELADGTMSQAKHVEVTSLLALVPEPKQEAPEKRTAETGLDGRPANQDRLVEIRKLFPGIAQESLPAHVKQVERELRDVKARQPDGYKDGDPILSVGEKLASVVVEGNKLEAGQMTRDQWQKVLELLAEVRQAFVVQRGTDGKMLPDQEVNWIHTQGEQGRVLEAAQAKGVRGEALVDVLAASMFSDSVKHSKNFTTHHLDGVLAAQTALERQGFSRERIEGIAQAIREHQIAPPEFMGMIYRLAIGFALEAKGRALEVEGKALEEKRGTLEYDKLKASYDERVAHHRELQVTLDEMTTEGKPPRIRQIARVTDDKFAPKVVNGNGELEVALAANQRELLNLAGVEHLYVPTNPNHPVVRAYLEERSKTMSEEEHAELVRTYKERYAISQALIDGDAVDNYATSGGASKIVKIRGPETGFRDALVWDSINSVDTSLRDAMAVMSPEARAMATKAVAERDRQVSGIRAAVKQWLIEQGQRTENVPFFDVPLKYPLNQSDLDRLKILEVREKSNVRSRDAGELNMLQERRKWTSLDQQESETLGRLEARRESNELSMTDVAELRILQERKTRTQEQLRNVALAKRIRDKVTALLRAGQRTDGKVPESFEPVAEAERKQPVF